MRKTEGGEASKFFHKSAHEELNGEERKQERRRWGAGDGCGFDHVTLRCLWSLLGPHVGCGYVGQVLCRELWAHGVAVIAVTAMASH